MTAPLGTWNLFTTGKGPLTLTLATSSTGAIIGTLENINLTGVWDETSQVLSFSRATSPGGTADAGFAVEVYTGTLFPGYATPNGLVSGEGVPLMLAGNFGTATIGGTIGPFDESGWIALNTIKFKEKEGKESKDSKDGKDGKDHKDKEQKDGKEKEQHGGHIEKLPEVQTPVHGSSMQLSSDAPSEVRIATGRSFIPVEERPSVGSSALQE